MEWTNKYPDKQRLKAEADAMAESYRDALLELIPKADTKGIYLKGSANKAWETVIDYVPELSDVDVHIYFYDDEASKRHLASFEKCFEIMTESEKGFFAKFPAPVHIPRPQVIVINDMAKEIDYIPSPPNMVKVLYGEDYHGMSREDCQRSKALDRQRLLEQEEFLNRFPMQIIDKPGKWLWQGLRAINWRVSPVASRVVSVLGEDPITAWSLNRTQLFEMLKSYGEADIAENYRDFYLYGWDCFLSGYSDFGAVRRAISAGYYALKRGVETGKK